MAQEQERLQARIEEEGNNLKQNLEEFEDRVKNVLDWKVWYRHNTALAIGGAAAGGLLLALLLPRVDSGEEEFVDDGPLPMSSAEPWETRSRSGVKQQSSRLHNVLDNSVSAVVGIATDQLQRFLSRAIPGFTEHYREAESRRR
jgi:hypothetical protein